MAYSLITCIIANEFVSSPIHLMTLDVYIAEVFIHLIWLDPGLYTRQAWELLVYPPRGLYYSCHYSDVHRR